MKLVLALLLAVTACHSTKMTFREVVPPQNSPYTITSTVESLGDDYFAITLSIKNGSSQTLMLEPTMFEVTAPPAIFLRLQRLSWGRNAFRMPATVAAGGLGNGQVFFQMKAGNEKPKVATLHVKLPGGDHQVVFDVE